MATRPTPAPKKASGVNIENWQRKTEQILLRLSPETAAKVRAHAETLGMSLSAYVTRLVDLDESSR